ncbi:MAG: hypothetical protein SFV32_04775 [Opitutaceae bacterium]|nr:hypothetical protein [Opitutaceae bacterium]
MKTPVFFLATLAYIPMASAQTVISSRTYTSGQNANEKGPITVETSGTVVAASGSNVSFQALTRVTLLPGFRAADGAVFKAQIIVDVTPPVAATGLTGTASGTSATLTWVAASDNFWLDRQEVWRKTGGGSYAKIGSSLGVSTISFVDSGLLVNTTYQYIIRSFDALGSYSDSTAASVSTAGTDPGSDADDDGVPYGVEQALGTNSGSAATSDSGAVQLNPHRPN